MDRINGADTIDIGGGRRGFRDENLVAGAAGTEVTALFLNMVQEEILKVVTEAGIEPSEADWTQLWQALQILGLAPDARSRRWLAVISMTLSSAPGAPATGDTYLVPTGATGIWATHVGAIAQWSGSAWSYLTPPDGHGISLPNGRVYERIGGIYVEKLALDAQAGKWNYAIAGGTANAITATLDPAPSALTAGMKVRLKIANTNTASATLNVNGLGAVSIRKADLSPSEAADMVKDAVLDLTFDGTYWQITGAYVSALPARHNQTYATAGTFSFVVPDGVYWIFGRLWGAGGGGGGSGTSGTESGGAGGAGGGYCEGWFPVTPGQSIPITVGAGGAGGVAGSGGNGTNGGASSIGSLATAAGGSYGVGVTSGITSSAGVGGVASGGQLNVPGSSGQGSSLIGSVVVGGMGGRSFSSGSSHFVTGVNGNAYSGAYPGGGGGGGTKGGTGGSGSIGLCVISY